MIIIEILHASPSSQDFTYQKESNGGSIGETGAFIRQHCLISGHYVNGFRASFPRDSALTLGIVNKTRQLKEPAKHPDPKPYTPGKYVVSPEAFYFDREELKAGRMHLQPLQTFLDDLQIQMQTLEVKKS